MYSSSQGIKMSKNRTYITPPKIGLTGHPAHPYRTPNPEDKKQAKEILTNIREQCLRKGLGGVKGMEASFFIGCKMPTV